MSRAQRPQGVTGKGSKKDQRFEAPKHPVESCPEFANHLKAAAHADRIAAEIGRITAVATGREKSLAEQFDRIIDLLTDLGYVDGWSLTSAGTMLAGIYHESDLLIGEVLRTGVLDGLKPPQLAGLVSAFVYEARGAAAPRRGGPSKRGRGETDDRRAELGDLPPLFPRALTTRWIKMLDLAEVLADHEAQSGVPLTRRLDAGFVHLAQQWASGQELEDVLGEEDVSGGDFVRTMKNLIDLLRQIGIVAPLEATASAARSAADALSRGVILASSLPTSPHGTRQGETGQRL